MNSVFKLAISKSQLVEMGGVRQWTRGIAVVNDGGSAETYYDLMCGCLDSDIESAEGSGADYLHWMRKVERGELDRVGIDGNAWVAHVTRDKVWFEGLYSQGEGGEVSFNQFKFAVETYMRYLGDPEHRPIEVEFPQQ